ncbi:MAG: peptidase T [Tannerellaceae bacterium]|jgi:tripeptide aminopeptidase|nr:peptidase T [Tannerellaceae bacterium]
MNPLDRFLLYVSFDTQSDPASHESPSSPGQLRFADHLLRELTALGARNVCLDPHGYLYASIPPTSPALAHIPPIGFIAHLDTSPDCSGRNVRPSIDGDFVRADGSTLLGADDKAGVAAIVSAVERLHLHPTPHGPIRIAFTPDEEIGRGADHFDLTLFGCPFAYTVDGGDSPSLEYENFNAAAAKVLFRGTDIHPGLAHGAMVNAALLAADFVAALPPHQRPDNTYGYQGFFHLTRLDASVSHAHLHLLLRDFDPLAFDDKKRLLHDLVDRFNSQHPNSTSLILVDQYRNMADVIRLHPHVIDLAARAITSLGLTPSFPPIRGGTDGARLSFMGLPCPNLFTGGANFHGPNESLHIPTFLHAIDTICAIASLHASSYSAS